MTSRRLSLAVRIVGMGVVATVAALSCSKRPGSHGGTTGDGTAGSPCTAGKNPQGSCETGYFCNAQFPGGYCMKACKTDADCGGGNPCVKGTQGNVCFLGCSLSQGCRKDYVCEPMGQTTNACLPDCRVMQSMCGSGTCDSKTGLCSGGPAGGPDGGTCDGGDCGPCDAGSCAPPAAGPWESCGDNTCQPGLVEYGTGPSDCLCYPDCSSGQECPSGSVCAMSGLSNAKYCVPGCANGQPCPTGLSCQPAGAGKACLPPSASSGGSRQPYETCDSSHACVTGSQCLSFPSGPSRCFQECATDSDCTAVANSTCILNGKKLCAVSCASDGGFACPSGSTCVADMGQMCL